MVGGTRLTRNWWSLVGIALVVTMQSPARITTLTVVVTTAAMWLYLRGGAHDARVPRWKMVLGLVAVLVGSSAYFQSVGDDLGKSDLLIRDYGESPVPAAVLGPTVYFTGGLSALTVALEDGHDPTNGNVGRSVFLLPRIAALALPDIDPPETHASFVRIPNRFNVFTAWGDMYFDFGLLGVILLSLVLGLVTVTVHARAMGGQLVSVWLGAVTVAVLASTAQAFRLFYVDIAAMSGAGVFAMWWISVRTSSDPSDKLSNRCTRTVRR